METKLIAAVVFDYGGVLSQPPYDGIVGHEAELGLPPGTLRDFFREGHDVYDEFLCGRISGREFMKAIGTHVQEHHGQRIDLSALAAALAYDVEPRMIELLRELHGRVKLGILTNNVKEASWRDGVPVEIVDVVVDSSEVALRKPDPRIYEHLVTALGVDPPAIVYFDDLEENLPPARALGMVAFRFETPEACRRQLADVGVL
jgi:epoxide hydrolase-like predicted phosphatase